MKKDLRYKETIEHMYWAIFNKFPPDVIREAETLDDILDRFAHHIAEQAIEGMNKCPARSFADVQYKEEEEKEIRKSGPTILDRIYRSSDEDTLHDASDTAA